MLSDISNRMKSVKTTKPISTMLPSQAGKYINNFQLATSITETNSK
ncbi:unnamed protein product [Prunus brigantina]